MPVRSRTGNDAAFRARIHPSLRYLFKVLPTDQTPSHLCSWGESFFPVNHVNPAKNRYSVFTPEPLSIGVNLRPLAVQNKKIPPNKPNFKPHLKNTPPTT
jgi:hypothetical protein